jgi:large subunit ribosomal protein L22
MAGVRTNERPGTRAQVRHARFSAYKAREVLDLIRGLPVAEARDVLRFTERGASEIIARCLDSAVANAEHNDELDGETLYVSACYADEGPTLKRWRPRARGRATRIRKRMCHITIIVSPMPPEMVARVEAKQAAAPTAGRGRGRRAQESRRARVARSRGEQATEETPTDEVLEDEVVEDEVLEDEVVEDETTTGEPTDEMVEDAEEAAEAEDDDTEPTDEADDSDDSDDETDADADEEKK